MIRHPRKPDAAGIAEFLQSLPGSVGFSDFRRAWPQYLFHTAELDNALSILKTGVLYSRESAIQLRLQAKDTADPDVIGHTSASAKNCARFYFRPKTPTQYKTESFRPITHTDYPNYGIPVVLIFDAVEIMTRAGTRFTDGNAGSSYHTEGDDLEFLRTIPFKSVYHEGWFSREERSEIVHRRHAEVLVPDGVGLDATLRRIGMRSVAELETFLCQLRTLGPHVYDKYKGLAVPDTLLGEIGPVFFREWTHFEEVWIAENELKIRLSRGNKPPASSFSAHFMVTSLDGKSVFTEKATEVTTSLGTWSIPLPTQCSRQPFIIEFRLDDRLVYRNSFPPIAEVMW